MEESSRDGERSDDLRDKTADEFKKVADRVEGIAGKTADQIREAGNRAGEVASGVKGAVDKSVKNQPMTTLALALAVGFVLGALWKS